MGVKSGRVLGIAAGNHVIDREPYEEPADEATARAAVNELGRILTARAFFAELIARGLAGAKQLPGDPLQGLTEILQNANDAKAETVSIAVRRTDSCCDVLVVHDGTRPVTLRDVLAMSAPWVTTKQDDSEADGRFGISFKIVHSFCDAVEVHAGHYHFEANGTRLHTAPAEPAVPGFYSPDGRATLIRLRLRADMKVERIVAWLRDQPDTNLLFLSSLHRIVFVDLDGTVEPFERVLGPIPGGADFASEMGGGPVTVTHTIVATSDGRRWDRFEVILRVPPDQGLERAEKSTGEFTRLSVALPRETAPQPLYVTFPMRIPSTLPFALNAQFDPVVSRASLQQTAWNRWLVACLGELVAAIACHALGVSPLLGWRAVPLPGEGVICDEGAWLMHDP